MPKLVLGDALAFVIPQHILGLVEVARNLSGHCETITVRRFPGGKYEKFKQIMLLAQRQPAYAIPSKEDVEATQAQAQNDPPPLDFSPGLIYPLNLREHHLLFFAENKGETADGNDNINSYEQDA
jgi:hypothetical protein